MTDKEKLLADFRQCVAGILNIAVEELPDSGKIALAQVLQSAPNSLRLHVSLEPFVIVGAVFSADRSTPPVEIFRVMDGGPSGEFH